MMINFLNFIVDKWSHNWLRNVLHTKQLAGGRLGLVTPSDEIMLLKSCLPP